MGGMDAARLEGVMTNLNRVLERAAADHGERPAVRMDGLMLSYAELWDAAGRMTSLLSSAGIVPGDRVAVMLPNVPAFPIAFFGALGAGAVVVPVNPLLKGREVAYCLRDSGATVLLAWHAVAGEAGKGAAEAGARVVEVTEPALSAMLAGFAPVGCLPLFHSFGLTCALNVTIISGSTLTLLPRFDPGKALEIIGRDKVTIFEGVPTMYAAMLHDPASAQADTSSLRVCVSGGAAMPVEIMRGFEQAFGCVILEGYGLSETSPVASFNHPDRVRKPGSIGTPIAGVQMRVVDAGGAELPAGEVGEVVIAGHNIMKGYWGKPEATAAAITSGWLRTGDLGRVDEDGYFYIVDRKKDMIIRGGFNVYPREVEEVLYEHPAVAEVAVIGILHDELGEEVGAAVTLRRGAVATPAELRAFAREQMAPYKYPRFVWLVPGLPKGPTGKILRREVQPPEDLR